MRGCLPAGNTLHAPARNRTGKACTLATDKQNPPVSIAEQERAWEKFRLAIIANLETPTLGTVLGVALAKAEFLRAVGE